jgi:hypothetical protein
MRLELIGTHQFLVYADDVNILGRNVNTPKENTKSLLQTGKQVGVEVGGVCAPLLSSKL